MDLGRGRRSSDITRQREEIASDTEVLHARDDEVDSGQVRDVRRFGDSVSASE